VPINSMTGFARTEGAVEVGETSWSWAWELRSVNAKGLDIRARVPGGFEAVDQAARRRIQATLARGSVTANLTVTREAREADLRINEALLDRILDMQAALESDGKVYPSPPRLDTLLSVRGVVEQVDAREPTPEERATFEAAVSAGLEDALAALAVDRAGEGARLAEPLGAHLDRIAALVAAATTRAEAQPGALRERLSTQLAELLAASPPVSEERLAQELALLVTKADVREETDRLTAHIAACRELMAGDGSIGRRLDFLCQELNREANTLCSKSVDLELTRVGLELKSVIEQFREQVQNVE
jgi:uncharacterized protein (TIGR00255 family)